MYYYSIKHRAKTRKRMDQMKHGKLNREQAVAIMGEVLVDKLDYENCEPTGRLQTDGDDCMEYSASLGGVALDDGQHRTLIAYYYTTPEQEQQIAFAGGDGSAIDWEIEGYEIV